MMFAVIVAVVDWDIKRVERKGAGRRLSMVAGRPPRGT